MANQTEKQQTGGSDDDYRPYFSIGQHCSEREIPLNDLQYGRLLNDGFSFVTAPVTNHSFRDRVFRLVSDHLKDVEQTGEQPTSTGTPLLADPIVPPLTPDDTGLFPCQAVSTYTAWISSWIDLGSTNPLVASISRQVLNLEIAYANFCGVRSVIVPGPRGTYLGSGYKWDLVQYARAIKEALAIGSHLNIVVHTPMLATSDFNNVDTLSSIGNSSHTTKDDSNKPEEVATWDAWHQIRSFCNYNSKLYVALHIPRSLPDKTLVNRWFAETLYFLTFNAETFSANKAGYPSLPRSHQDMLFDYMRLRNPPWLLLCNVGPDLSGIQDGANKSNWSLRQDEFPSLGEASDKKSEPTQNKTDNKLKAEFYVSYLRWLESQQPPPPYIDDPMLRGLQDYLQSPLQPLSDNLESSTYEVFEEDPVKYRQYEQAITSALAEWKQQKKPTSSKSGAVVIAVAGSGRGPLVTRSLRASETAGVPVEVWAVEKNPNAYVYLLRQNSDVWGNKVNVVKTDMRSWKGPTVAGTAEYGKVDILVSELLGSFGDNELSPECLDGIQHVLARPTGISIPKTYTAHFSPISTPKIYSDLLSRSSSMAHIFDTPWVVRLHAIDFVSRRVPRHARFQQAWEFSHPLPESTSALIEARRSCGVVGGGGGSMAGAVGANDHNSRYCKLTFVCPTKGVVHGLAGYFESILFASSTNDSEKVELSIVPDTMDHKSKDMVSWFPIFFPLKRPLYFPNDTELDISMWRQTDDGRVWYEWMVEAYVWVSSTQRIRVGESDMCSSRKVACLL